MALGTSGGLVPCSYTLVVLLMVINRHCIPYGMLLKNQLWQE
jgi:ABC-type nickel/cobalt efflux system permease component RcnA